MAANGERSFVTYRAMFGALGVAVGVLLAIFGLYLAHMEKKVSRELYDIQVKSICTSLEGISAQVEGNAKVLRRFGKNQELVLRALKIEPVRDFE